MSTTVLKVHYLLSLSEMIALCDQASKKIKSYQSYSVVQKYRDVINEHLKEYIMMSIYLMVLAQVSHYIGEYISNTDVNTEIM